MSDAITAPAVDAREAAILVLAAALVEERAAAVAYLTSPSPTYAKTAVEVADASLARARARARHDEASRALIRARVELDAALLGEE